MFGFICRTIFSWWGFKVIGNIPNHLPKKLYVVLPHTSNWDFPLGILLKFGYKMDVGFIAKKSLFKWPFAWFFTWLGGIPVDRKKSHGFLESVVKTINSRDKFSTAIAPEGTRNKVKKIKTGFYFMALKTNIPIVYVKFDWENKKVVFEEPHYVADTLEKEMARLHEHFKDVRGKVPEYSYGFPFEEKVS